jgi:probable rRNA maturation factor
MSTAKSAHSAKLAKSDHSAIAAASTRLNLSVQYVCHTDGLPARPQLRQWARAALDVDGKRGGQITVRFVDNEEGLALNRAYRGKESATNVLSFPYALEPSVWGDLVLCAPVVEREAAAQNKPLEAHFAHLIVHGMLHLQGYDHEQSEDEARKMENQERKLLATLGYPDPYSGET